VVFFEQHARLPVLGEAGAEYEAQQSPVYYVAAGLITAALGTHDAGFVAVRLFGVVGAVVMTLLIAAILGRATRQNPAIVVVGTAFVALNPMLIVMSASVQNDTWALVPAFGAMLLAMTRRSRRPWWHGVAIGVLGAVAILVKISVAPLVIAIVIVLLCWRRFAEGLSAILVVVLGCGWWVVRNLLLYGDFTGQSGVDAAGFHFGRGGIAPPVLAREVLTYLTLPTEYLRNSISSPAWLDVVVIVVGVGIIAGLVVLAIKRRSILSFAPVVIVVAVALASVAAWLLQIAFGWQVAFRTAYGVLPLVALAYGACPLIAPRRGQIVLAALLIALVATLTVWTGAAMVGGHHPPMLVL
jgi:D-alanyl-D-alanine carboxypeptidase (penicillin-binding protein 5/6)